MIIVIINNDNDYQYQNVADFTTKNCIGAGLFYVYVWLKIKIYERRQNINSTIGRIY